MKFYNAYYKNYTKINLRRTTESRNIELKPLKSNSHFLQPRSQGPLSSSHGAWKHGRLEHGGIEEVWRRRTGSQVETKMAGKSSSKRLYEITSEWFLDYCIYQLWKEFKEKYTFSDCWRDTVQGNKENCVLFLMYYTCYQVLSTCVY